MVILTRAILTLIVIKNLEARAVASVSTADMTGLGLSVNSVNLFCIRIHRDQ